MDSLPAIGPLGKANGRFLSLHRVLSTPSCQMAAFNGYGAKWTDSCRSPGTTCRQETGRSRRGRSEQANSAMRSTPVIRGSVTPSVRFHDALSRSVAVVQVRYLERPVVSADSARGCNRSVMIGQSDHMPYVFMISDPRPRRIRTGIRLLP